MKRSLLALSIALAVPTAAAAQGVTYQPGELVSSVVLAGSAVTLTTTNTTYDLTSVTLSPGTWQCSGNIILSGAGTTFPSVVAAMNTASVTLPTAPAGGSAQNAVSAGTGVGGIRTGLYVTTITAATTIYLSARGQFTGTAPTMYGELDCVRLK